MDKKPSKKPVDLTIKILQQIRDHVAATNTRLDRLTERVDHVAERVDHLDGTMQAMAEQQRFVVRGIRGLGERDRRLEKEVAALRGRVDVLERRGPA
jgi:polyhydroxyalkanoate synthesis regulator phasin